MRNRGQLYLLTVSNHDNFDLLESYPVTEWNGGKVHMITDSVIHLMRGQVYNIDGVSIFTCGGAMSIDRGTATGTAERDHKNGIWWPQEKITGFDFFQQLDDRIENKVEDECNPAAWGI